MRQQLLGRFAGDDFDFAARGPVCRVALCMVPVEVRIHQVTHRLVGDLFLYLRHQRGRG